MKIARITFLAALVAMVVASPAWADSIPYPSSGLPNPDLYTFTATSTGDVTAYFHGGTGAAFTNELTMLVNGVATGIQGLNNHSSPYGTSLILGSVTAGDVLVFEMVNLSPGGIGPWYSTKSLNSDGVNHVYSTSFSGDSSIPAGTYVAFEDIPGFDFPDYNYNDLSFVFTNVSTTVGTVPEPSSLLLLGVGVGLLGLKGRNLSR